MFNASSEMVHLLLHYPAARDIWSLLYSILGLSGLCSFLLKSYWQVEVEAAQGREIGGFCWLLSCLLCGVNCCLREQYSFPCLFLFGEWFHLVFLPSLTFGYFVLPVDV